MLLVDAVDQIDENSIVCRKTFQEDEYFFQGHYPDFPIVPGVILCECAAQAGAILLSQHADSGAGVPVLTRMNDVKFKTMVRPGDTIEMSATLGETIANAFFLKAKVTVGGKIAVRLSLACALAATA